MKDESGGEGQQQKDLKMLEAYIGKKKRRSGMRVFRCVLVEHYEVFIAARSKQEARNLVDEYGGNAPFKRSERIEETDKPLDTATNLPGS